MSEPNEQKDLPTEETTPVVPDATLESKDQPAEEVKPVVPDLNEIQEKLSEAEAQKKRYLEQLHGKDQLIETLRANKLKEYFQPQKVSEPVDTEDEYEDEVRVQQPKPAMQQNNNVNFAQQLLIDNAITMNEYKMQKKYGSDKYLPYSDAVQKEVDAELDSIDPTGIARLRFDVIDTAYDRVRSRKLEEIVLKATKDTEAKKQKEIKAITAKERTKSVATVESSTKSEEGHTAPAIEDVISGKVKMSSKEMVKTYPEYFGPNTKKLYGVE